MNVSGTIAAGGTAQVLAAFPANLTPRGFWIQNLDEDNSLFIRDDGTDASAGAGSIVIPPLHIYESPSFWPVGRPAPSLSVFSETTGHTFSAEWY